MSGRVLIDPVAPHCCPIRQRTGDGVSVGRCWHHCPGDVCPLHGDVAVPLAHYRATGRLTDENDIPKAKGRRR